MFDELSQRFEEAVKSLRGQATISETNVEGALKDVRRALRRELQALCAARAPKARWQWSEPPRNPREIRVQTFPLVEEQDLLPPPSEVVAIGTNPAASAAADPPLEPPGEQSVFHGLRVAPNTRLAVNGAWPKAGVLVRPRTIAPAARSRATASSSLSSGSASTNIADP